ncbi:MAG: hypothetical protein AAGA85_11650 [Bacteroidota bacterium]
MRKVEKQSMGVIWFDLKKNLYQYGSWSMFNAASKGASEHFDIIYELKEITANLATKIVMELNAARFESERTHNRAA